MATSPTEIFTEEQLRSLLRENVRISGLSITAYAKRRRYNPSYFNKVLTGKLPLRGKILSDLGMKTVEAFVRK